MHRGKTCFGRVRIGASLQQQVNHLGETGVGRHRRSADAPGIRVVHVSSGRNQHAHRIHGATASRKHQGGVAAVWNLALVLRLTVWRHRHDLAPHVRRRVDVSAARQQRGHHVSVLLRRGPHQRRLPPGRACVRPGPVLEQKFHDARRAGA